ncbi:MAG: hypothetical protein V1811_03490, partial [Candidatus Micrarchaeota archaeon]
RFRAEGRESEAREILNRALNAIGISERDFDADLTGATAVINIKSTGKIVRARNVACAKLEHLKWMKEALPVN